MNRKHRSRIFERSMSLLLSFAVMTACMPLMTGIAFAEDADTPEMEDTVAYLVNEDGTETEISEEELEELRENSVSEIPEDIEVVLGDDVTDDIAGGMFFDDEGAEPLEEDGILLFAADDEAEAGTEEDGMAVIEEEAAGNEDADRDVLAAASDDASPKESAGEEEPDLDGGNVEQLSMPGLLEMMKVSADEAAPDSDDLLCAADSINYKEAGNIPKKYHNLTITQSGSTVTVKGEVKSPWSLAYLFVDGDSVTLSGQTVNKKINMNNYDTGYHTVALGVINPTDSLADIIGKKYLVTNKITERPGYNGVFEVYSKYFDYYPYDMGGNNASGRLYMEYSSNGGKTWQRTGYMQRNSIKLYIQQAYSISGLKAKTTYKTRIRYGEYATYSTNYAGDGKSYFFGGPVRNTTTITTGAASKPKIKSVKAKAVKIKYHKVRHYGKYTGVYLYTEKFYTCKIKVTVKLKKKPGTKGLFINGVWVKGNKKTYSKTFKPYPNYYAKHPRGRYKYSVTICSGMDKNWGGYSPTWSKKKKLS